MSHSDGGFGVTATSAGRDVVCLHITGELDLATRPAFEAAVGEALESGRSVLLDLSRVSFIDSTGLAAIIGSARRAEHAGVLFQIAPSLSPQTQRLLELTGVTEHLPFASPSGRASPTG